MTQGVKLTLNRGMLLLLTGRSHSTRSRTVSCPSSW